MKRQIVIIIEVPESTSETELDTMMENFTREIEAIKEDSDDGTGFRLKSIKVGEITVEELKARLDL